MSRDEQRLKRLLTLIPALRQRSGERVDVLAEEFGLTPKQLIEELNTAVLMCGTPPYSPFDMINTWVEGDRVYVQLADHFRAPARLSLSEALAARLALEGLGARVAGPFSAAAASLREKLDRAMGGKMDGGEVAAAPEGSRLSTLLSVLDRAVREYRVLEMVYYTASRDALSTRKLRPYGLIDHGGTWYVVGKGDSVPDPVPFRVDRIREAKFLTETFKIPSGFKIEKFRLEKMYLPQGKELEVEIRFSATIAPWVREMIPAKQLKAAKDGSLRYTLLTASPDWVARWVLEWGGEAEVLRPPSARKSLQEMCRKILATST